MSLKIDFRHVLAATMTVFVLAVLLLSTFGKESLDEMSRSNVVVDYLDLGRQAALRRDYVLADSMYQKALASAFSNGASHPTVAYSLLNYAEFLRKRKRLELARQYEAQARSLQGQIH